MIFFNFDVWNYQAGEYFHWHRILYKGYKWTPFCRVRRRASSKDRLIEQLKNKVEDLQEQIDLINREW